MELADRCRELAGLGWFCVEQAGVRELVEVSFFVSEEDGLVVVIEGGGMDSAGLWW